MRQRWIHAAAYDTVTGPLKRAVLHQRRARLLSGLKGHILDVGAGPARTCRTTGRPRG